MKPHPPLHKLCACSIKRVCLSVEEEGWGWVFAGASVQQGKKSNHGHNAPFHDHFDEREDGILPEMSFQGL